MTFMRASAMISNWVWILRAKIAEIAWSLSAAPIPGRERDGRRFYKRYQINRVEIVAVFAFFVLCIDNCPLTHVAYFFTAFIAAFSFSFFILQRPFKHEDSRQTVRARCFAVWCRHEIYLISRWLAHGVNRMNDVCVRMMSDTVHSSIGFIAKMLRVVPLRGTSLQRNARHPRQRSVCQRNVYGIRTQTTINSPRVHIELSPCGSSLKINVK